jgi:hypothetical protein
MVTTKIISVFFTDNGTPVLGLVPTINIWELDIPVSNVLVVTNGLLTEIGEGLYRYDFTTYDYTKNYAFVIDGGATLTGSDRYKYGGNESYEEDISYQVWEETATNHLTTNTMGLLLNLIKSDTTTIIIDEIATFNLLTYVRKLLSNRNRIDQGTNTLILYDDDKVTPLLVFNLKDFGGAPSINPIAERTPQ